MYIMLNLINNKSSIILSIILSIHLIYLSFNLSFNIHIKFIFLY